MPGIKLRATAWFFVAFQNSRYVIYSNLNSLILIWSVLQNQFFDSYRDTALCITSLPRLVLPLGIVTWSWEYIGVKVYTEIDTRVTLESKFMNCEKPNKQRNAVLLVLILS